MPDEAKVSALAILSLSSEFATMAYSVVSLNKKRYVAR
jgi:hypothetical protein